MFSFLKNESSNNNPITTNEEINRLKHESAIYEALLKSSAIIEFKPDGTILDANQNFLKAMGYELDQIKGKHHRIFCLPEYANSKEYSALWSSLATGSFFADTICRVTADGSIVWLEASYNPVKDESGKVKSVIKLATDVTASVLESTHQNQLISALNYSSAVIEFDLTGHILTANDNFTHVMKYNLDQLIGKHHRIFCVPTYASSAEYERFWQDLRNGHFKSGLIERIDSKGNTLWLEATYNPVKNTNGEVCRVVKMASDVTERVNADKEATEAVYATSTETEQISEHAKETIQRMLKLIESIASIVDEASVEVVSLNAESDKINAIVDTILSIAEQTNLLALNAAIEAARAGEQGRGFAVVAEEVRNLAKRTSDSIAEITGVVQSNSALSTKVSESILSTKEKTKEAEVNIEQVSQVFDEISQAVQHVVSAVERKSQGAS